MNHNKKDLEKIIISDKIINNNEIIIVYRNNSKDNGIELKNFTMNKILEEKIYSKTKDNETLYDIDLE